VIAAIAALIAWLGASVVVLAEGRRGLAAGMGLTTIGLFVIAWQNAGVIPALAVLAGGGVAAFLQEWSSDGKWDIMPAGSTPRVVLCVAFGLLGLWFAASVTSGSGISVRFTVLAVIGLMGARVLSTREIFAVLAAVALLALAIAGAAPIVSNSPWPYFVGAAIAALVMFIPQPRAHAG
jgi:hypothetical protein